MPFDGILTSKMVIELKDLLIDARVDKIKQPEKDELIITFRAPGKNHTLLLSSNNSFPRFYLTEKKYDNPLQAPMFCMLLRKHLGSSRLIDIRQEGHERIIKFIFEARDELGDISNKTLHLEIMGKHSNIIFTDKNNIIIDSIKRIPPHISIREILPGRPLKDVPALKKYLLEETFEELSSSIKELDKPLKVYKFLYTNYQGLSPLAAKLICKIAEIEPELNINELNEYTQKKLFDSFDVFLRYINEQQKPYIVLDNKKALDYYVVKIDEYYDNYTISEFETLSGMLEVFFFLKNLSSHMDQKTYNLRKLISTRVDRFYNKLSNLQNDLDNAEDGDNYRLYGELLTANLFKISKGMSKVEVDNYYDNTTIEIPLDVRLSANENAQAYYKKYNKSKTALIELEKQISETIVEIEYLENVLTMIENSTDMDNVESIKLELEEEGYLKKRFSKKKQKKINQTPIKYRSSGGFDILVGKNNFMNDELTLKVGTKKDVWFHTKDIPGSHVIVVSGEIVIDDETIKEAAMIAAYHSRAKSSSQVPVDYTEIRYVKKPTGSKPGMVIYTDQSTMYVTPDIEKIEKLRI